MREEAGGSNEKCGSGTAELLDKVNGRLNPIAAIAVACSKFGIALAARPLPQRER
jgi:hypothetical protein